jgi:hypothetical protein
MSLAELHDFIHHTFHMYAHGEINAKYDSFGARNTHMLLASGLSHSIASATVRILVAGVAL